MPHDGRELAPRGSRLGEPSTSAPLASDLSPEIPRSTPSSFRENLRIVFPLFFVGAASFVLSLFLFQSAGTLHPSRVPLWLLSLSIGVVATAGASTAVFFGDFSAAPEGIGESALRSGEYLLVPRSEWNRLRAALLPSPRLVSPSPDVPSALGPTDAVVAGFEETPAAKEPPSEIPLWQESIFTPDEVYRAGRSSRATDHLAEQVDELIRELDIAEEPSKASVRDRTTGAARAAGGVTREAPTTTAGTTSSAAPTEKTRGEYASLLRQLKTDAERSVDPTRSRRDLLCGQCDRTMGVDEPWEACRGCWRTFCPDCLRKIHPRGRPFSCPKCGRRE